tara:strand:+ start:175 stop:1413 length:1239 start_codon:yes stop_codon:yes gene_type:complete
MKVIHISYSNYIGGASIAAYRIHRSLRHNNIDSSMWTIESSLSENVHEKNKSFLGKLLLRLRRYLTWPLLKSIKTSLPIHHSISLLPSKFVKHINASDADVVHLHWIQREMISISDLARIKKPVVWTLHDMWAFCGAEHYTSNNRWLSGYLEGNRPEYESGFDLNRWTWQRKKRHWKKPFEIITPSKWLGNCVGKSKLMNTWPITVIPNPIDIDFWKPVEKKRSRHMLKLHDDITYILFGAHGGSKDPRKGFDLFLDSLIFLKKKYRFDNNIELLVFGENKPKKQENYNFKVTYLGQINSFEHLKLIYNATDVLVIPSRQDNFPNIAIEAHACGTPIVGFDIGGLADIIKHKKTGYLAKSFDSEELAYGISWTLKNNLKCKLNQTAREYVINNFSEKDIASKYSDIYSKVSK